MMKTSSAKFNGVRVAATLMVLLATANVVSSFRFEINNMDPVCIVEHLPKNEV